LPTPKEQLFYPCFHAARRQDESAKAERNEQSGKPNQRSANVAYRLHNAANGCTPILNQAVHLNLDLLEGGICHLPNPVGGIA
jgi:hypothetical protein